MTRRSLFAMLLGLGAAPAAVLASRRSMDLFWLRLRQSPWMSVPLGCDPPLILREGGALRPFNLPAGLYSFKLQPRSLPWFEFKFPEESPPGPVEM